MWEVMTAYVIMHNMIIEDERPEDFAQQDFQYQGTNVVPEHVPVTFAQFIQFHNEMRDYQTHIQLQDDLVEHMWTHVGNQ